MPLKTDRFFVYTDTAGEKHTLPESQQVQIVNNVLIVCDGPRCATINNPPGTDNPQPVTYQWKDEQAAEDPLAAIPEGVFSMISAEFERNAGPKAFCGVPCLRDYIRDVYVPPMSPRQKAEQDKRNAEVAASKLMDKSKAVHLVDKPADSEPYPEDRSLN